MKLLASFAILTGIYATAAVAQYSDSYVQSRDHAAIEYSKGAVTDRVAAVNRQLQDGKLQLKFDGPSGYLRSALDALNIPVESQVAVFAQNSSQGPLIGMKNPRALYFADAVAIGFVRGGKYLEVAAHDPRQGVIFYTLDQTPTDAPQFKRDDQCLACHLTWSTRGVPGLFVLSMLTLPDDKNSYASGFVSNHTTSFDMRWGGWYVTGNLGSIRHMGNLPVSTTTTPAEPATSKLNSLEGRFDLTGYPTPYSDVAALLVLEHQTHIINLITRLGWEARLEAYEARADAAPIPNASIAAKGKTSRVEVAAADLVDYALFVYETPLPDKIRGSSGFTEKFSALGPADSKGRSLRQLDLGERLMKYPCSYMIYSDAFDALPAVAKDHVYRRLWQVLSGQDKDGRYTVLSTADRRAIVEILRDTKKDLPDYFKAVTK
jgi:hypothetical protein